MKRLQAIMGATARSRSIVINCRVVVHLWREATATVGPVLGTGTALYHHHRLVDERLNESSSNNETLPDLALLAADF